MALNEDQQTEAVFKSSRTDVDPVSGNDVPPGSLPEEVRDDIPAQLSEGEYVVPADVLRFYGMKFFEDLRTQAKMELARMDAEGRIGGEPVGVKVEVSAEELTPEEMKELDSIGVAMGGFIPPQQTPYDPYQQQQMMYQQQGQKGYQEGGLEDGEVDYSQPTYTTEDLLDQFGPGFSFTDTSDMTEYTTVTLYGPDGDVLTLTLPTQQDLYDQKIAEGYTTEQVAVTTETEVGKDDRGDTSLQPKPTKELDVSAISSEDLEKTAKGLSTMNNIATAIASTVGLPVAAFVNTAGVAKYNDIIERMDSEGIEHDLERKSSIFGGESSLFENLQDTSGDGKVGFGDTWLGDLLGFDGEAGVQGASLSASRAGARRGEVADDSNNNDDDGFNESSAAASNFSSAATGLTTVRDSDGGSRNVTTYDADKVKETAKTTRVGGR